MSLVARSGRQLDRLHGLVQLVQPRAGLAKYQAPLKMDFYYDTVSPYSYFAFEILQRYQPLWNLEIQYNPILLAGLAKAIKSKYLESNMGHPNKMLSTFKDLQRISTYAQIPLNMPEDPLELFGVVGSLQQQRFLTAVKLHYPDHVVNVSRNLFRRCWHENKELVSPESLTEVGQGAGLTKEQIYKCLEQMSSSGVKEGLKNMTNQAMAEGAPGLPYIVIQKGRDVTEAYFGSDRFELIAHRFDLKYMGPLPMTEEH